MHTVYFKLCATNTCSFKWKLGPKFLCSFIGRLNWILQQKHCFLLFLGNSLSNRFLFKIKLPFYRYFIKQKLVQSSNKKIYLAIFVPIIHDQHMVCLCSFISWLHGILPQKKFHDIPSALDFYLKQNFLFYWYFINILSKRNLFSHSVNW